MSIELFTANTPNGIKISILLEELHLAYTVRPISLAANEQKEEWFLKINPNGRIPAIVDHGNGDFAVFESGAIMVYLAKKAGKLLGINPKNESIVMQWLMFQVSGLGPMMGQANIFYRYADQNIPYAIDRYQRETRRLLEVLDRRLATVPFLAEEYSIADIANWSWAQLYDWSGVSIDGLLNLQRWLEDISKRPAVKKGMDIPENSSLGNKEARISYVIKPGNSSVDSDEAQVSCVIKTGKNLLV